MSCYLKVAFGTDHFFSYSESLSLSFIYLRFWIWKALESCGLVSLFFAEVKESGRSMRRDEYSKASKDRNTHAAVICVFLVHISFNQKKTVSITTSFSSIL